MRNVYFSIYKQRQFCKFLLEVSNKFTMLCNICFACSVLLFGEAGCFSVEQRHLMNVGDKFFWCCCTVILSVTKLLKEKITNHFELLASDHFDCTNNL